MQGMKAVAVGSPLSVGSGAAAQPASTSALDPISAIPPSTRPREVILKVSSKVLPGEERRDIVPYRLPTVARPERGKAGPSLKGYKLATTPQSGLDSERQGRRPPYWGVFGLDTTMAPLMMSARSWSISPLSSALTLLARS